MMLQPWADIPPENLIITALLPLTALMLVTQSNPYHALVIRGILGAVAALVYAIFGAADVALTEALVGTMLSITLYAVAVRSSMSLRLGYVQEIPPTDSLTAAIHQGLRRYHLRLELVPYSTPATLNQALSNKEIHAICLEPSRLALAQTEVQTEVQRKTSSGDASDSAQSSLHIRLPQLYQVLQKELPPELAVVSLVRSPANTAHLSPNLSLEQSS